MDDPTARTTTLTVEILARTGAFVFGFLYLCGFLVVSIHLSQYGIYSVSLLRTQYVSAGILSLAPLIFTCFVAVAIRSTLEGFPFGPYPSSGRSRARKIVLVILRVIWEFAKTFIVAGSLLDGFASVFVPGAHDILWSRWRMFLWLTAQSAAFFMLLTAAWRSARGIRSSLKEGARVVLPGTFCVFLFFSYLNYFTRRIYPEIPFAIGGGKPQEVVFFLKEDSILIANAGARSAPYKLILETDKSYTVISPDPAERAIQFNRDAVAGYAVLAER